MSGSAEFIERSGFKRPVTYLLDGCTPGDYVCMRVQTHMPVVINGVVMTSQMQTLSARVPADDFAWLSSLAVPSAITPSDKLRALIMQMRKQHEGALDYTACVAWLRDLLSPLVAELRGMEHRHQLHSAAITAIVEWTPQVMATLLAGRQFNKDDVTAVVALERTVVQQCFQLLATLLRLGVTPRAECYSPEVIEKQLPRVLELTQLIYANRTPKEEPK